MLRQIILLFYLLLLPALTFAQKVTVEGTVENIAGGINNVYKVSIPHTNAKQTEKKWTALLKQHKARVKESKGVIRGENTVIPAIGSDNLQIYCRIKEGDGGVVLVVAVDQDGIFMSATTSPSDNRKMEDILRNFGVEVAKEGIEMKLEIATAVLSTMNKEKKDLTSVVNQLSDDNERMKKTIAQNEEQIKANTIRLESLAKELEEQQSQVELIRSKPTQL